MTKIFATPANFNGPLCQSQIFFRTLNIFTYYLRSLLLIQPKKFNFKAIFYFQKSVKRGPLTKTFPTPANFNGPLCQSQIFFRTLNIFPYYLSYLIFIQHKNFNFKHIFFFLKSVKWRPLTKTFETPSNFNGLLYQCQDFFRTLNIFSIEFELPTIDSAQNF